MINSHLSILQWNMGDSPHAKQIRKNQKERSEVLTDLLNQYKPTIVTLQEVNRIVLSKVNYRSYELHEGPSGLVTLILKNTYSILENTSHDNRFQLIALDSLNRHEIGLKIINLHLPTLYLEDFERHEKLRKYMPSVNIWRTKHEPRYEIMSGDFNLPPYDTMLMAETGIFANRDLKHALSATSDYINGFGRALYNTSWIVFGGNSGAPGTYYKHKQPHGPWYIPDQVLIDPKLVGENQVIVNVLTSVNGKLLTTPRSFAPDRDKASDHFPMLVSIQKNSTTKL